MEGVQIDCYYFRIISPSKIKEIFEVLDEASFRGFIKASKLETDTVNAEKSWTFPKKVGHFPKKVGHHPKKSWTFPKKSWTSTQKKLDIIPKICKTIFKICIII